MSALNRFGAFLTRAVDQNAIRIDVAAKDSLSARFFKAALPFILKSANQYLSSKLSNPLSSIDARVNGAPEPMPNFDELERGLRSAQEKAGTSKQSVIGIIKASQEITEGEVKSVKNAASAPEKEIISPPVFSPLKEYSYGLHEKYLRVYEEQKKLDAISYDAGLRIEEERRNLDLFLNSFNKEDIERQITMATGDRLYELRKYALTQRDTLARISTLEGIQSQDVREIKNGLGAMAQMYYLTPEEEALKTQCYNMLDELAKMAKRKKIDADVNMPDIDPSLRTNYIKKDNIEELEARLRSSGLEQIQSIKDRMGLRKERVGDPLMSRVKKVMAANGFTQVGVDFEQYTNRAYLKTDEFKLIEGIEISDVSSSSLMMRHGVEPSDISLYKDYLIAMQKDQMALNQLSIIHGDLLKTPKLMDRVSEAAPTKPLRQQQRNNADFSGSVSDMAARQEGETLSEKQESLAKAWLIYGKQTKMIADGVERNQSQVPSGSMASRFLEKAAGLNLKQLLAAPFKAAEKVAVSEKTKAQAIHVFKDMETRGLSSQQLSELNKADEAMSKKTIEELMQDIYEKNREVEAKKDVSVASQAI